MSTNRFAHLKPKLQDNFTKDLTPKASKYSPKISPVFASLKTGITMKPDQSSKIKLTKPSTAKNANEAGQFFHSKDTADKKTFYNSNKRLQMSKPSTVKNVYQYQPRSKSKSPIRQQDQIIREEVFLQTKIFKPEQRKFKLLENPHPALPKVLMPISHFEPAKHSKNANGNIKAYAASTNQGPIREYNEDRVAIILNISKPQHCVDWKKAAYFGVFDGHGGVDCADFLRDNLHNFISKQRSFPNKMEEAVRMGFQKCQKSYLDQSYVGKVDKSGSCGIIAFIYGKECFISNVGDSRAIMSCKRGNFIQQLSLDHKASEQYEQKRIIQSGGRIYQTKLSNANPNIKIFYQGEEHYFILGPHRAFPGRLSVTRTFGDIQAKYAQFGGNSKAIVCSPQIYSFTISENDDFILLACDGIFDKLTNEEVIEVVWDTLNRDKGLFQNIHQFCGKAVQNIMKLAFNKKTLDNITVVMVALQGLENYFNATQENRVNNQNAGNQVRKSKVTSKMDASFERKYVGRSVSPTNYASLRTKSYYRPS